MQQLGRGTRRCPGKDDLLVIDFVDNANMFNMPYSLHRVLNIAKYQPMAYVLAPENKLKLDQDMLFKGEKLEAWLDVPIDVDDYEIIDLFNWQNSVKDMISQIELVRMVDVQSETVERYIKDGKIKPDLSNPFKRFEDMRFLMRCKDVETVEVNPIIFRKLTRKDWLHIVDVCDKSLEKYYLRIKSKQKNFLLDIY